MRLLLLYDLCLRLLLSSPRSVGQSELLDEGESGTAWGRARERTLVWGAVSRHALKRKEARSNRSKRPNHEAKHFFTPRESAPSLTVINQSVWKARATEKADFPSFPADALPTRLSILSQDMTRTALHDASELGHLERVRLLLDEGAGVDAEDDSNGTPLHRASWAGHLEVVCLLLDKGARVDAEDMFKRTPLHFASCNAPLEVIRLLLDKGARVEAETNLKHTPLHKAAACGRLEVARLLVDAGADLCAKNNLGSTPRDFAAESKCSDVVAMIDAVTTSKEERREQWGAVWSAERHHTFPPAARRRAASLLVLGSHLANRRYAGESRALLDVWCECVLPRAMGTWGDWWEP